MDEEKTIIVSVIIILGLASLIVLAYPRDDIKPHFIMQESTTSLVDGYTTTTLAYTSTTMHYTTTTTPNYTSTTLITCYDTPSGNPYTCNPTEACCGGTCADDTMQCCYDSDDGNPYPCPFDQQCCGGFCVNPSTSQCCDDDPDGPTYQCGNNEECCAGICIDPSTEQCCLDHTYDNPQECDATEEACCSNECYDPTTQMCCGDMGDSEYNVCDFDEECYDPDEDYINGDCCNGSACDVNGEGGKEECCDGNTPYCRPKRGTTSSNSCTDLQEHVCVECADAEDKTATQICQEKHGQDWDCCQQSGCYNTGDFKCCGLNDNCNALLCPKNDTYESMCCDTNNDGRPDTCMDCKTEVTISVSLDSAFNVELRERHDEGEDLDISMQPLSYCDKIVCEAEIEPACAAQDMDAEFELKFLYWYETTDPDNPEHVDTQTLSATCETDNETDTVDCVSEESTFIGSSYVSWTPPGGTSISPTLVKCVFKMNSSQCPNLEEESGRSGIAMGQCGDCGSPSPARPQCPLPEGCQPQFGTSLDSCEWLQCYREDNEPLWWDVYKCFDCVFGFPDQNLCPALLADCPIPESDLQGIRMACGFTIQSPYYNRPELWKKHCVGQQVNQQLAILSAQDGCREYNCDEHASCVLKFYGEVADGAVSFPGHHWNEDTVDTDGDGVDDSILIVDAANGIYYTCPL